MLGAAADSVSSTLDSRRTRKELSDLELETKLGDESRAMDNEEELFRRKDKRLKKTELENWIATINSYLPADEAQKRILEFSNKGHKSVGVLAARLAALGNAGYNAEEVLRHNQEIANPEKPNAQFLNLLATPKEVTNKKSLTTFQAMLSDNSAKQINATGEDLIRLRQENKKIETDFAAYLKLLNGKGVEKGEYTTNFTKVSAESFGLNAFRKIMQVHHNIDLSMSEQITNWNISNEVLYMDEMVKHNIGLKGKTLNFQANGMEIKREPGWAGVTSDFNRLTMSTVRKYIQKQYVNNQSVNTSVSSLSKLKGYVKGEETTMTKEMIQTNLNNGSYAIGDVVPYLQKIKTSDGEKVVRAHFIYTGYRLVGQNIISAPSK